jgi:hypothetical protein
MLECIDFRFENVDLRFKGPEPAVKEWIQPQSEIINDIFSSTPRALVSLIGKATEICPPHSGIFDWPNGAGLL